MKSDRWTGAGAWTLGLDVSTSCVGWSILSNDAEPEIIMGAVKLSKEKDLFDKAARLRSVLSDLFERYPIKRIYVEEDLQRFRPGMSSAHTIQLLSRFNGMACLVVHQLSGIKPIHLNVNAARKEIGCVIDRKDKTRSTKEKVFEWVTKSIHYTWPVKVLKVGVRKGETEIDKSCFDMADAYVVNRAGRSLYP